MGEVRHDALAALFGKHPSAHTRELCGLEDRGRPARTQLIGPVPQGFRHVVGQRVPAVGQVANITLQPKIFGVSLNFSQIGQVTAPTAIDCKGTAVTVTSYTYATFLPNGQPDMTIADVQPTTGRLCAGTWNRNTGGGIADFTTCNPTNKSGTVFSIPGLDGVSLPECLQCPSPDWPTGQGTPGRDGNVVLSILVTLEGNPQQMSVVQSLDPVFDRAALECVRSWRFAPAKDADGNPVPVRLPVQITFKRRWQIR